MEHRSIGVTLSVNLLGAPTMTSKDFQALRADPHPILGASLKVVAPTGQYDPNRLLNTGGNRWGVKAELGTDFDQYMATYQVLFR